MHRTYARKVAAPVFALLVALAGASPALAVEQTGTTPESLEVLASITLAGVPAAVNYGSRLAGEAVQWSDEVITLGTSNPGGARLEVKGTNLTGTGGTIPATARSFTGVSADTPGTMGGGPLAAPDTYLTLYNRTSSFSSEVNVTFDIDLAIPPTAGVGSYGGSLTFRAVSN